jgi:hypothetical protein
VEGKLCPEDIWVEAKGKECAAILDAKLAAVKLPEVARNDHDAKDIVIFAISGASFSLKTSDLPAPTSQFTVRSFKFDRISIVFTSYNIHAAKPKNEGEQTSVTVKPSDENGTVKR